MLFCGLIKGISPKFCVLCVHFKINKHSFEPFCVWISGSGITFTSWQHFVEGCLLWHLWLLLEVVFATQNDHEPMVAFICGKPVCHFWLLITLLAAVYTFCWVFTFLADCLVFTLLAAALGGLPHRMTMNQWQHLILFVANWPWHFHCFSGCFSCFCHTERPLSWLQTGSWHEHSERWHLFVANLPWHFL